MFPIHAQTVCSGRGRSGAGPARSRPVPGPTAAGRGLWGAGSRCPPTVAGVRGLGAAVTATEPTRFLAFVGVRRRRQCHRAATAARTDPPDAHPWGRVHPLPSARHPPPPVRPAPSPPRRDRCDTRAGRGAGRAQARRHGEWCAGLASDVGWTLAARMIDAHITTRVASHVNNISQSLAEPRM